MREAVPELRNIDDELRAAVPEPGACAGRKLITARTIEAPKPMPMPMPMATGLRDLMS